MANDWHYRAEKSVRGPGTTLEPLREWAQVVRSKLESWEGAHPVASDFVKFLDNFDAFHEKHGVAELLVEMHTYMTLFDRYMDDEQSLVSLLLDKGEIPEDYCLVQHIKKSASIS